MPLILRVPAKMILPRTYLLIILDADEIESDFENVCEGGVVLLTLISISNSKSLVNT